MSHNKTEFYPFYDPCLKGKGKVMGYDSKVGISVAVGLFFNMLLYLSIPDKAVYFEQNCWFIGVIISTSMLALYIATDVFRRNLVVFNAFEGSARISQEIVTRWLSNKHYWLFGLSLGTIITTVMHLLGIPGDLHGSALALALMYVGYFLAGLAAGMGVWGIFSIIVLYLKFAPNLPHALDPDNPDGSGGIKPLGDALWFFAALILAVGILVSIYMFGVSWENMHRGYAQMLFVFWTAFPYLVAISVVLIPGLAFRRQVTAFKHYKEEQLNQEKARIYAKFKDFELADDEAIITSKKALGERLSAVQEQMKKLRKMRNSHIDGGD
jgi:MFS family permease